MCCDVPCYAIDQLIRYATVPLCFAVETTVTDDSRPRLEERWNATHTKKTRNEKKFSARGGVSARAVSVWNAGVAGGRGCGVRGEVGGAFPSFFGGWGIRVRGGVEGG